MMDRRLEGSSSEIFPHTISVSEARNLYKGNWVLMKVTAVSLSSKDASHGLIIGTGTREQVSGYFVKEVESKQYFGLSNYIFYCPDPSDRMRHALEAR